MKLGLEAGADTLELAVRHGVKGVPIDGAALAEHGVAGALAPLRERGLEVCQIGAFGYNPLQETAGQAEQQRLLEHIIPLAADTGCPYIVVCGGNVHPSGFGAADPRNFTAAALEQVARQLDPLVRLAERHGAKLSVEAYLKTAVGSPERFLELWDLIGSDALCVNIDVTSLYDVHDLMAGPGPKVAHVCRAFAGHYGLVHVKDVTLKEGFHVHIDLAPLGSSPTDWAELLRLADPHLSADSWAVLEHVASADEAATSLAHLRRAADRAGVALE